MIRSFPLRLAIAAGVLFALWFLQRTIPQTFGPYINLIVILAGVNIILAVSLTLINGITGQFSLGHAGFMAVGAYVAASFTVYVGPQILARAQNESVARFVVFLGAILLAAIAAGFAGWLVGLPSLRLRGDYLAIVTLGFGQIIIAIVTTIKEVGGALGFTNLPLYTNFLWVFALVILCVLSIRNLAVSHLGRSMKAVRDDEIAAAAIGINTTKIKVLAFVIGSMWAGVAGALSVHLIQLAQPDSFNFVRSVEIVVMVVLGGLGSITGATITAVLLTVLENVLRTIQGAFIVGLALVALAAILSLPRHRPRFKTEGARALLRWLFWPLFSAFVLCAIFFHKPLMALIPTSWQNALPLGMGEFLQSDWRGWFEARVSALRFVIYALILIVLMLLRPQGLLGRSEFSWNLFRRAQNKNSDQNVSGALE